MPAERTKTYDTNEIIAAASETRNGGGEYRTQELPEGRQAGIRPGAGYELRHLVENGFLEFKQWRGIATRYAMTFGDTWPPCELRAAMIWIPNSFDDTVPAC